jgi:sodium transport system permease protein
VVLGKLLAVITTSLIALILAVGSMLVSVALFPPVGAGQGSGFAVQVDPRSALLILLAALPIVLMFSALEMAVCLTARSFKEAQNYIVPLQFIVLLPAMAVMVLPDYSPSLGAFAIPIWSTLVVLRDILQGQISTAAFAVMGASSVVYAALAIGLAIWQFGRERVLFRM